MYIIKQAFFRASGLHGLVFSGQVKVKIKRIDCELSGFFPCSHLGTVGSELIALCRPPPC